MEMLEGAGRLKLFGKKKVGNKRTLHIFGIKISYKKRGPNDPEKTIDKRKIQEQIDEFTGLGVTETKRTPKVIVSLTSFPQRMRDLHFTLYSLLSQTLKPDEVVLWLGQEQFPGKEGDLPQSVLSFLENGLTIKWCRDMGPYKKLIPGLKEYPEDIIVTADDDIYYPQNWLELLYKAYLREPGYIHCHRAHRILFKKNGNITRYSKWRYEVSNVDPSFLNFQTGGGGALYPPNAFHTDVLDEILFSRLSPTADDIWFWAMAVLNEKKINVIDENICRLRCVNLERELRVNGDFTLSSINVGRKKNDEYMKNILNHYPQIRSIRDVTG